MKIVAVTSQNRYAFGLAAALIGLAIHVILTDVIGPRTPFLLTLLLITAVAALAGPAPATIVLATSVAYGLNYVVHNDPLLTAQLHGWVALATFSAIGVVFIGAANGARVISLRASEAEQKLSNASEKLRAVEMKRLIALFQQAPGFMAILRGPEHVYEFENEAHRRFHGYRNILGKTVREAFPEVTEQASALHDVLDQVYRTGEPYRAHAVPLMLHRKPGAAPDQLFMDFVYQPIFDDDGTVASIFVEGFDVTDRMAIEEAFKLSQNRLQEGMATAKMTTWDWDPKTGYVAFSDNSHRYFGAQPEALHDPWQLVHAADIPKLTRARDKAIRAKQPYIVTVRYRRPDNGETGWVEIHGNPHFDATGRLTRVSGVTLDVTARMRAETTLNDRERARAEAEVRAREAGERLELAIDAADLGTFHCPMPLDTIYWNATCKAHFFLPEDTEVNFDLFYRRIHDQDRERVREAVNTAVSNLAGYDIQYRTVAPDGRSRWIRAKGRAYCDPNGVPTRFDGITIDITRQKQTEEDLQRASSQKDDFLAMLAHELRNPLAPISAAASMLGMADLDHRRNARIGEIISRQVKHMAALLSDLLDVSRVTRGVVTLGRSVVDIKKVVSAAAEQVHPLVEQRRHTMAVHLPPEACHVLGDETRLVQVIANLVNNAVKYTPEHGTISVTLEAHLTQIVVRVADNGIGIPPELVDQVFELFVQGKRSPDRQQGGLGLGLALAKNLVVAHNGVVKVDRTAVGQGTEISVTLPRYRPEGETKGAMRLQATSGAARQYRIMVVDDNADAAETMAMVLGAAGHDVYVETSSMVALDRALALRPDLLLLDIGMPIMDGNELARRLRAHPDTCSKTLVAVSGYGQEQDRRQTADAGFDYHMVKP